LLLDGQPLPQNPFAGARPADAKQHVLRAEAPGYEPAEHTLTFDRNLELDLVLKPSPPAASAKAAPAALPGPGRARAPSHPVAPAPAAPPGAASAPPAAAPAPAKTPFEIDRTDPWKQ
jgi:serine/threonine-protein kinase